MSNKRIRNKKRKRMLTESYYGSSDGSIFSWDGEDWVKHNEGAVISAEDVNPVKWVKYEIIVDNML